jgi:hypothetical protein
MMSDEKQYDPAMVTAFLLPRESENVPAQYAHELAQMAFAEHRRAEVAQAERDALALRVERAERVLKALVKNATRTSDMVGDVIITSAKWCRPGGKYPGDFDLLRQLIESDDNEVS